MDDLPDEILLMIFKNLNNIDLLYSLIDVNKRLKKISHDSMFTNRLRLFDLNFCDQISPLSNVMLNRFCFRILPEIHNQIQWLELEYSSMERILLSAKYPNLFGLGIYNIEKEVAVNLFNDETSFLHPYKTQISSFVIRTRNKQVRSTDLNRLISTRILHFFTNLRSLNLDPSFVCLQRISFEYSPSTWFSSTLLELRINVEHYTDCLCLLDDRFSQLRTFDVRITFAFSPYSMPANHTKLPNLRCFSLYALSNIRCYDHVILPLLQRMSNLEQLDLYLSVERKTRFIDGNDLQEHVINSMPYLKQFRFNIRSTILLNNEISLLSNDDVERSLKDLSMKKTISCVNYFFETNKGQCHIYSYPFTLTIYENLANHFPDGLFPCVREVSLYDEYPFEYEYFLRIARSFPLMKKLTITNSKAQKTKRCRKLPNTNENLPIINYHHLKYLDIDNSHDDYLEQFLVDRKTCLPDDVHLLVDYQSLKRVTHKFTRKTTRMNCAKMRYICFNRICRYPKYFQDYFRHVNIGPV